MRSSKALLPQRSVVERIAPCLWGQWEKSFPICWCQWGSSVPSLVSFGIWKPPQHWCSVVTLCICFMCCTASYWPDDVTAGTMWAPLGNLSLCQSVLAKVHCWVLKFCHIQTMSEPSITSKIWLVTEISSYRFYLWHCLLVKPDIVIQQKPLSVPIYTFVQTLQCSLQWCEWALPGEPKISIFPPLLNVPLHMYLLGDVVLGACRCEYDLTF